MENCPQVEQSINRELVSVCPTLVLASQSPNRRKILEDAGVRVIARPQDIWEICGKTVPEEVVKTLSRQKFDSYLKSPEFDPSLPAVAVDTLVCYQGKLLGKPQNDEEAFSMLRMISGKWHEVYSGMSVYNPKTKESVTLSDVSRVLFKDLSDEDIRWYISTGDCIGAAGAYKIQRNGYKLIEKTEGSLSNIIGLPLEKLISVLS